MERDPSLPRGAAALVFALALASLGETCATRVPAPERASAAVASSASDKRGSEPMAAARETPVPNAGPAGAPAAPTFEASVRPILTARCSPCHFPGGVMYERLPFDRPAVLSGHAPGVRKRLKDQDLETFERWLATLPAESPEPGR
jgi:hypothetical protein